MTCIHCKGTCIRKGYQKNGAQRIQCEACRKYQQQRYLYVACLPYTGNEIVKHLKEGCGISSIARLLGISITTVISRIKTIAGKIKKPPAHETGQEYEVDELYTYVGNKDNERWVIYAMNRKTRQVIDFCIGARTSENTYPMIASVLATNPGKIYTDGWKTYPGMIPATIHQVGKYFTNKIERMNLTLRTHLKRLGRKTICFSKSEVMLESCLRIYFWGDKGSISNRRWK